MFFLRLSRRPRWRLQSKSCAEACPATKGSVEGTAQGAACLICFANTPSAHVFLNCDIPFNQTQATLTLFLFALTIQNMNNAHIYNAGFFRPDHDPPCHTFCASIC